MLIGELARRTNTKVETIRFYEREGLLPAPERTSGNYRMYGEAHLKLLSFIRRARALGFSIDQVTALLELADCRDMSCEAVEAMAQEHLANIEAKIADLSALRRALSDLIGQCRRGTIAECRILDALAPTPAAALALRNDGSSSR